jgi:mono/diheme cytochrome c family protein
MTLASVDGVTVFAKDLTMTPDIKRILVPVDFSATSQRALDYAHGLALKFEAVLHLVHVCEVPSMMTPPVLTEREPRPLKEPAVAKARLAGVLASMLVASVMFAPGLPTPAAAQEYQQTTTGGEVFRTYCASCHGAAARGDGPLASAMNRKPADLTEIAKRNGGIYPSEMVFKIIDGRQQVRGHGGPDMPVWGDVFTRSRDAGDAERVKAVIQSLVDHLGSIQLRTAHHQQ